MTVPSRNDPLASGAVNYLWPGVQTDNAAATVLQTVLEGNTGKSLMDFLMPISAGAGTIG